MIIRGRILLCVLIVSSAAARTAEKAEFVEIQLKPEMSKDAQPSVLGHLVIARRGIGGAGIPDTPDETHAELRTYMPRTFKLILSDELNAKLKAFAEQGAKVDVLGMSTERGFEVTSVTWTAGQRKNPVLAAANRPVIGDAELRALMQAPPVTAYNLLDEKGGKFVLRKWPRDANFVYVLTQEEHIVRTVLSRTAMSPTIYKDESYTVLVPRQTIGGEGKPAEMVEETRTRKVPAEAPHPIELFAPGEAVKRESDILNIAGMEYKFTAPEGIALQLLLKTPASRSFVLKDKDGNEFKLGEWTDQSSLTYVLTERGQPVKTVYARTLVHDTFERKFLLKPESKDADGAVVPAVYDVRRMRRIVHSPNYPPLFQNGESILQQGRKMNVNGEVYEIVSMLAFSRARLQKLMASPAAESYLLKDKSGKEYRIGKWRNNNGREGREIIFVLSDDSGPIDTVVARFVPASPESNKEERYAVMVAPARKEANGEEIPAVYEYRTRKVPVKAIEESTQFPEGESVRKEGNKMIFNNESYELIPPKNDEF